MNWSNWIYLGAGLLLGMGFCGLFWRKSTAAPSPSVTESPEPQTLQQLEQVQLAYQMAREMSQFKAGFLARTTHELRSPLNGLIGLHQLILSDLCENADEEREFIAQAHDRALKLLKLIDEILRVARTEHGTNKLDIQPLPLAELLQEVYQLIYLLAANRNYPLQVLPPDPDIYVVADYRWLRQILVNLVDTAIAQMEEGSICISSSPSPTTNSVNIWLDVPMNALPWSESVDFIKSIEFVNSEDKMPQIGAENTTLSPGMKLLLNQTLLEAMGGKLEIVSPPNYQQAPEQLTRLQISVPLLIQESELLQYSMKQN
ncbi:sensor histidine kinase [Fortiea contorta]|uniref:sensor histidine kinase n=1 Tax=Fortiea contorta TaxID=1892405 RepID=UPI00036E5C9E|nr:HAMP domain-containing sensor histidine kinase [Fortiea contorta]